jgi:hypothetical protein
MSIANSNIRWISLLAVVIAVALAGSAYAATLTVPVTAHAVVENDDEDTRILVEFGSLDQLAGKRILYAKCYLDIGKSDCGDVDTDNIIEEVEVRLMGDDWDAGTVSFDATLETAAESGKAPSGRHADLQRGSTGMTEILLTEAVRTWVDEEADNHGLLLLLRIPECDYDLNESEQFPAGTVGKLVVRYNDRGQ